jgi:hypothetical protein
MAHTALAAAFVYFVHRFAKSLGTNLEFAPGGAVNFYACHYSFINIGRGAPYDSRVWNLCKDNVIGQGATVLFAPL